jgi:exodeoxyribonuclease VII small subunit
MSDGQILDSQSFNKNYKVLKETADWLSRQEEPDIDQLVPKVERAMQAYRICKDRLDKVQETLGEYLRGDGADGDGMAGSSEPENGEDEAS